MKRLKTIRIILALLFLAAAAGYLLTGGMMHHGVSAKIFAMAERMQIIPSAFAVTMGATSFWIAVTCLVGRVYCSTVCPLGTLQDLAIHLRRRMPEKWLRRMHLPQKSRWRAPKRWRYDVMAGYIICLLLGFSVVPLLIEPWQILRDAAATAHPDTIADTWGHLAYGVMTGAATGLISLTAIVVWGFFRGREFCTTICPLGTAMGAISPYALYHIEIDPDLCISCMKCEDGCRCHCIKVKGRYVDNTRCVRCLDCITVCPNQAIRLMTGRLQRPASPLLRRKQKSLGV